MHHQIAPFYSGYTSVRVTFCFLICIDRIYCYIRIAQAVQNRFRRYLYDLL